MARKRTPGPGAPPLDSGVAEMRALAHPLRLRIMELFAEAPRTTKQVAELLGQPPTRLYHHVAALERAGLLRLKETRKNRGTVEKWYESIARTFTGTQQVRVEKGRPVPRLKADGVNTRRAMALTVLEQSRQEVLNSLGGPVTEAPLLARLVMVGSREHNRALRKRLLTFLQDVQREFSCDEPTETEADDIDRWSLTLTFAPTWPRQSSEK